MQSIEEIWRDIPGSMKIGVYTVIHSSSSKRSDIYALF